MEILNYDGSFSGFLTAVFEAYERKIKKCKFGKSDDWKPDIFSPEIKIITDENKAERVWKGLKSKVSKNALKDLVYCFLSEIPGIEQSIFLYIQYVFTSTKNVENNFGYDPILKVSQTSKKVFREKHRFEAFIRFQLLKDDLYFAYAEPDFNILPLIKSHFQSRYPDQKWLIYDLKRNYGIYYNLSEVVNVKINLQSDFASGRLTDKVLHPDERLFQLLWKDYFSSSNIASRKNLKLHLQHMPQRYWKYLTEKI